MGQQLRGAVVAVQCRTDTALTSCCSGGGPQQPWSSRLAPVLRFHSSVPPFHLSPSLIGLLASLDFKQQKSSQATGMHWESHATRMQWACSRGECCIKMVAMWNWTRPRVPTQNRQLTQNRQTQELIITRKTSHKHRNKDMSHLRSFTWHASEFKVHKLH